MKRILRIKADQTCDDPSLRDYDAEAMVRDEETGEIVYVHVNAYEGAANFTVTRESLNGFMTADWEETEDPLRNPDGSVDFDAFEELTDEDITDLLGLIDGTQDSGPGDGEDRQECLELYRFPEETRQSAYHSVFERLYGLCVMMRDGMA